MQEGPKRIIRAGAHKAARAGTRAERLAKHRKEQIEGAKGQQPISVGFIVMAVLGGAFCAYAFNLGGLQTSVDGCFSDWARSMRSHDGQVSTVFMTALPFIAMAAGLFVIWMALKLMSGDGQKKKRTAVVSDYLSVHQFAELAAGHGVGPQVARETYRMLLPDYGDKMRTMLAQSLTLDHDVSPQTVMGMFEELVAKSGGVIRGRVDVAELDTPISMMQAAERCVERAALERRAALQIAADTLQETSRTIVPIPRY